MTHRSRALLAGAAAAAAGLMVFLVVHDLWIVPIWFILPIGLPIAVGAGLAMGWAYHELLPHLPRRTGAVPKELAIMGLVMVVSAVVLVEAHRVLQASGRPAGDRIACPGSFPS